MLQTQPTKPPADPSRLLCPHCQGTGTRATSDELRQAAVEWRKYWRITATEVAHHMDVSDGYVCHLEKGRKRFTVSLFSEYVTACRKAAGEARR